MEQADRRMNQGDSFVPGLHGEARLAFWVDNGSKFWLPFFEIPRRISRSSENPSCLSPTFE
jgi:hypothetical protein